MRQKSLSVRWVYLALGVLALLFAGVIYAWSILKAPLADEFRWTDPQLALNFTLTMCSFCLGAFAGGLLCTRLGPRVCMLLAAGLSGSGFALASRLSGQSIAMLYLSYGVLAGFGIGIAYNTVISTVGAWFPDRRGLCSGALMMGFGASALVVGNLASRLIEGPGWQTAYLAVGCALAAVLAAAGLVLRRPAPGTVFPAPKARAAAGCADCETADFSTGQMVRRSSFWMAFAFAVCLSAVGNAVISFARDLALSVGAAASLATSLVGVLSVCNGLGRIAVGALFDRLGRRRVMALASLLTIAAAGITLLAIALGSLFLCVLGLCLTGFSYGSAPTINSALISDFYGAKYFPLNFSVMNFNLMGASFMATAAGSLLQATGGYTAPLLFLLALAVLAQILNLGIKRP